MSKKTNDLIQLFIFIFRQIDKFFIVQIFVEFEIFVNFDIHKINFRIIDFENRFFNFAINNEMNQKICLLYFFLFRLKSNDMLFISNTLDYYVDSCSINNKTVNSQLFVF